MKLRKVLAMVAASALAVSAMAVSSSAVTVNAGEAILGFGDSEWKVSGWGKADDVLKNNDCITTATITGNGTYTVAIDLSAGYVSNIADPDTGDMVSYTTANGIGAMGIVANFSSEDEAYNAFLCKVTSVKFDGVETLLSGVSSYTNNEDGMKRTNVMNAWAAFKPEADVAVDAATANPVLTDFTGEWTKCEVTFEVSGLATDAATDAAETDAAADGDTDTATEDKGNADTGAEGVAAVAGLAIVAAGAIVVAKKRK